MKAPLVTTFAIALPDTEPIAAEATTAAFAGPPVIWPKIPKDNRAKNCPPPQDCSNWPKKMKSTTYWAITESGMPNMPVSPTNIDRVRLAMSTGGP